MKPLVLELVVLVSLYACARPAQRPTGHSAGPPKEIRRFDLVPRGYDLNGFALNPEWGWSFERHKHCGNDQSRDPATCSWRFLEEEPSTSLPDAGGVSVQPCNTYPMSVDFSNQWSTWLFGVTCSDSYLIYPGHLNWGQSHGGAVTFEGTLTWDNYATDGDYNFVLDPGPEGEPGPAALIGVEINSGDFRAIHSHWFQEFKNAVHLHTTDVGNFVGARKVIVTGLFGIDSEHMSARDMSVELHPVYAMAVEVGGKEANTDEWAFFVRNSSDEGFCSHRDHAHVVHFGNSRYTFRLPLSCPKADLEWPQNDLCGTGDGVPEIAITVDQKRREALVTILLPEKGFVDGDLRFKCTGRAFQLPAEREPRHVSRSREGRDRLEPTQQKLEYLSLLDKDGSEMTELKAAVKPQEKCGAVGDAGVDFGDAGEMQRAQVECDAGVPLPLIASQAWTAGGPADAGAQTPASAIVETARRNPPEKDYCNRRRHQSAAARAFCAHAHSD